jgi:three-Cys-motif partner protein
LHSPPRRRPRPHPGDQVPLFPDDDKQASFERSQPRFSDATTRVWSENKAAMIERYLYNFVFVTKHGIYIDGFAGPQRRDEPEKWSAKRVLELRPKFLSHFFLCELDPPSIQMLTDLVDQQPPPAKGEARRTYEVIPGDFNKNVDAILSSTATFALFRSIDTRTRRGSCTT